MGKRVKAREGETGERMVGALKYAEIEKIVHMAKEKRIQKLKVEGLEIEFAPEAYVEDVKQMIGTGPVSEAIKDEDMLFYSAK